MLMFYYFYFYIILYHLYLLILIYLFQPNCDVFLVMRAQERKLAALLKDDFIADGDEEEATDDLAPVRLPLLSSASAASSYVTDDVNGEPRCHITSLVRYGVLLGTSPMKSTSSISSTVRIGACGDVHFLK